MLGPNCILPLLMLAAAPSASAGQAQATDGPPQVQTEAQHEDASPEAAPTRHILPAEGVGSRAGTASAGDVRLAAGQAMPQEDSPFHDEPSPIPPGDTPQLKPHPLGDPEWTPPPSEPPVGTAPPAAAGTVPAPYVESPLDELISPAAPQRRSAAGCDCAECAGRGTGGGCAECAACAAEYRRPPRTFWGFGLDGWISQGVTINTDSPADGSNFPVTFNDRSNDYQMNQFYLLLTRAINTEGCRWDVGGRVDLLYGTDSVFTTARGLEVRGDLSPKWNAHRYGIAMPQAYMEVYAPWGNGLTMKLGRFYTILGYETVPAVENFFYSKSLALQYAEPFTHTGFLGSTRLGILNFHAGMTRGWDNWEDNNNDLGFLGGIDWTSRDERTSIAFAIHVGREGDEPPANNDFRTLYSLVVQHWLGERLQYVAQYDHGFDEGAAAGGRDADWFGVNQYLYYTINPCWRLGVRGEWFRDEDAVRIDLNAGADYYELSLGLNWMPNDWITVRPEIRWDWANPLAGGVLPSGRRDDQVLLAADVIARF